MTDQYTSPLTRSARGRKSRRDLYASVDDALRELARIGGLLTPAEAEDIWGDIWFAEVHHSTAIEGNILVLKEVTLLLAEGRAVGNKQLADYREVQGYGEAAQWVYPTGHRAPLGSDGRATRDGGGDTGALVSARRALESRSTPRGDCGRGAGSFRQHNIHPFPGGMGPLRWTEVPAAMHDWVTRVCGGPRTDHSILEEIADWFAAFEHTHPFLDRNGRAGRLLTNLVPIQLGYPPARGAPSSSAQK